METVYGQHHKATHFLGKACVGFKHLVFGQQHHRDIKAQMILKQLESHCSQGVVSTVIGREAFKDALIRSGLEPEDLLRPQEQPKELLFPAGFQVRCLSRQNISKFTEGFLYQGGSMEQTWVIDFYDEELTTATQSHMPEQGFVKNTSTGEENFRKSFNLDDNQKEGEERKHKDAGLHDDAACEWKKCLVGSAKGCKPGKTPLQTDCMNSHAQPDEEQDAVAHERLREISNGSYQCTESVPVGDTSLKSQASVYNTESKDMEKELQDMAKELRNLKQEFEKQREEVNAMHSDDEAQRSEIKRLADIAACKVLQEHGDTMSHIEAENERLSKLLCTAYERSEKLEEDKITLQEALEGVKGDRLQLQVQVMELTIEKEQLKEEIHGLNQNQQNVALLQEEKTYLQDQIAHLQADLTRLQHQIAWLQAEKAFVQENHQAKVRDLESDISKYRKEFEALDRLTHTSNKRKRLENDPPGCRLKRRKL